MNNEHERQANERESEYRARVEAAAKAGKRIEATYNNRREWASFRNPDFTGWGELDYRIAPGQQEKEPAKAREWWVVFQGNACVGISPMHPEAWQRRETGEAIKVREVLPGDEVEALRAENVAQVVETLRVERDAAIEARDNALAAMRGMRAELDKVTAQRDEQRQWRMGAEDQRDKAYSDLGRLRDDHSNQTGGMNKLYGMWNDAMADLVASKDRIISLQDELAVVRNECATLSAKLTEATR